MREEARKLQKRFPVLWDEEGKLAKKFRIGSYPSGLLVGADGKVVWVGSPTRWQKELERSIRSHLRTIATARETARSAPRPGEENEPVWEGEREAIAAAREDGRWVLLYKYSPIDPGAKRFRKEVFGDEQVRAHLENSFHCILSEHPKYTPDGREPAIWKRSDLWDKSRRLWLLHPKSGDRKPLDYLEAGKPLAPGDFLKRLKAATAPG